MAERSPRPPFSPTSHPPSSDTNQWSSQDYNSDKNRVGMTKTTPRDDSVIDRPESPTLPPEGGQDDVYEDIPQTPKSSFDQPRSPGDFNGINSTRIPLLSNSSTTSSISSDNWQNVSGSGSFPNGTKGGPHYQSMERTRSVQTPTSAYAPPSQVPPSRRNGSSNQHLRHAVSANGLHHKARRPLHVNDHMAAAIELSASPNVPLAPAAGMYWSRAITYGRGPSRPLRAHTADLVGEHLYVFGGCDIKTCFNILYVLDMDTLTWSKPRTSGHAPPPCRAHSCTVVERDSGGGKRTHYLYVFGGGDGPNYFNDLHILNTDTLVWTKPLVGGSPPSPRRAHTTCLWNNKIIVVGGGDGARALADVHALDISDLNKPSWTQLDPSGSPPIARGYHTSNLVKDKLIVFGGSDGHECFNDVFVLDLVSNQWTQIELDRGISRLAHTATQVGSYVFVIGGHDGSRYSNDILLLNLVTMNWESRKIYGVAPSPRGYHTSVLYDSRLYILGGYDGRNVFEDVYQLDLSACAYLPQITNFEIDV